MFYLILALIVLASAFFLFPQYSKPSAKSALNIVTYSAREGRTLRYQSLEQMLENPELIKENHTAIRETLGLDSWDKSSSARNAEARKSYKAAKIAAKAK